MLGLLWAWFLRERWGVLNPAWIAAAVIGSVLPDVEHITYFLGYGRKDTYTQQILTYLKSRQWRNLFRFVSSGHKTQTSLAFHNIYTVGALIGVSAVASAYGWRMGVVFSGAMASHYLFDMADDLVQLGEINANWKRWGRPKSR